MKQNKKKSIKTKIAVLNLTTIFTIIFAFLLIVYVQINHVEGEMDVALNRLIDMNISTAAVDTYLLLNSFYESNGKPAESDVDQVKMAELKKNIYQIRVGKSGYVYILRGKGENKGNYIISKDGARDGENIFNAKDSDGRLFIQAIVKKGLILEPKKIDYERYPWKNKDETKARMKRVAITYFEPWDWVIGSSAYEDDFTEVKGEVNESLNWILYWGLLAAGILTALFVFINVMQTKKIISPLNEVVALMKDYAEGEGDLTKTVRVSSRDEVYDVASWFNYFVKKIRDMILQIKSSSYEIVDTTDSVAVETENLATRTNEQAAALTETSTTLDQFSKGVHETTKYSTETDEMLEEFSQKIQEKHELVNNASDTMDEIVNSSKKIDQIVNVINDISFQTNLLALNAAVEAARAGEAGRGFAVVAAEVRNLAQKTAESSKSIQDIVSSNVDTTQRGMELVKQTAEFFSEIMQTLSEVVAKIEVIADRSKEQNTGLTQINEAVGQLQTVSANNNALVDELTNSSTKMKTSAGQLQHMVEKFKVD